MARSEKMGTTNAKGAGALICDFEHLVRSDVGLVGGKNSSLGEMISTLAGQGIAVPPGFATTSHAYWNYIDANGIREKIGMLIAEWQAGHESLAETGRAVRRLFLHGSWPADVVAAITKSGPPHMDHPHMWITQNFTCRFLTYLL